MTTAEFSNEFDILYDSIASASAPGLDEYEKSVFLTKAQLELVKEYNGPANKYKQSFEGSDKRRADLRELVVDYSVAPVAMSNGVEDNSQQANLPSDVFLIKWETGFYTKPGCPKQTVAIVPIKYDEYHEKKRNPFRRPNKKDGFRLDIQSINGVKIVELVTLEPLDSYHIRYVKYPTPIVLADLGGISQLEALTIDGESKRTECSLDVELHREILDRAVELAMVAYRKDNLSAQVQLDQRNN